MKRLISVMLVKIGRNMFSSCLSKFPSFQIWSAEHCRRSSWLQFRVRNIVVKGAWKGRQFSNTPQDRLWIPWNCALGFWIDYGLFRCNSSFFFAYFLICRKRFKFLASLKQYPRSSTWTQRRWRPNVHVQEVPEALHFCEYRTTSTQLQHITSNSNKRSGEEKEESFQKHA